MTPTFSIIVPTYNRPGPLADCLSALARLDYPRECFEVTVVDDGSTCDLSHAVEPYRAVMKMTYLRSATGGLGAARNTGASVAAHEFLAFTD